MKRQYFSHPDTSGMAPLTLSVSRVAILFQFWQTPVPDSVETFIRACTVSYGKAKLVLKHNKHYIESPFPEVLRELLKNATVGNPVLVGSADERIALFERRQADARCFQEVVAGVWLL